MIIEYNKTYTEPKMYNTKINNIIIIREQFSSIPVDYIVQIAYNYNPYPKDIIILQYLDERKAFPLEGIRSIRLRFYNKKERI